MGLEFRRGDFEEETKEMLEKEEINCDIKGKDEGGKEEESYPSKLLPPQVLMKGRMNFPAAIPCLVR